MNELKITLLIKKTKKKNNMTKMASGHSKDRDIGMPCPNCLQIAGSGKDTTRICPDIVGLEILGLGIPWVVIDVTVLSILTPRSMHSRFQWVLARFYDCGCLEILVVGNAVVILNSGSNLDT